MSENPLSQTSGTFPPAVIEDIQAKAASGLYRIRGWGTLRERRWATFDDLTFLPCSLTRIPLEGYREKCSTKTRTRHALCEEADRARCPGDDHGHELGRALVQRQSRAGAGRARRPARPIRPATAAC